MPSGAANLRRKDYNMIYNQIPISDTNSTLYIEFDGKFTDEDKLYILNTVEKEISHQTIHFNDITCKHWSFDYKSKCGYWIENIEYTNSLRKVNCVVKYRCC